MLPDVIPDWVLDEWPVSQDPWGGTCKPDEPPPVGWAIPGVTWGADTGVSAVAVSPLVRALQDAADRVCALDPTQLAPEQAIADAEALERLGQQLRVHGVARLADVTDRRLHDLRATRSTVSWLRDVRPDADTADARLGARLRGYPTAGAAVAAGSLSLTAAGKVLAALARCRPHVDRADRLIDSQPGEQVVTAVVGHVVDLVAGCLLGLAEDDPRLAELLARTAQINASAATGALQLTRLEQAFVLLATHAPPALLSSCLDELVLSVVPSILEDRAQRGRDRAGLSLQLHGDGSGWRLEGDLDLQCGERLWTALRAEARRDQANPLDTAAAAELRAQGLDPFDPQQAAVRADSPFGGSPDTALTEQGWPRSRRRRLHDALDGLLGRYLEQGLGGRTAKKPVQVSVTIPASTLTGAPGARPAVGDSGSPLPRTLLRRWWCDSLVTAYVLSRGGRALRSTHLGRTLTASERRGAHLEARGRCAGVGCCRSGIDPTVELVPHHVRRWTDDGVTRLDDTVLICDVLHRDLHEGQRTVRLRDGRLVDERGWVG